MTRVEAARPRLDWFGRHFLTGKAQSGWAAALQQPIGNREQLSVFELWERKSRRNELCVFWRRSTEDLRDALRALGLSTQTPLVVGTGHGSDFGVVEMSFDEAFSRSLGLLEGLTFLGQDLVVADNHSGGTCICCVDAQMAERLRTLARVKKKGNAGAKKKRKGSGDK